MNFTGVRILNAPVGTHWESQRPTSGAKIESIWAIISTDRNDARDAADGAADP
jgi:hypothetical protein